MFSTVPACSKPFANNLVIVVHPCNRTYSHLVLGGLYRTTKGEVVSLTITVKWRINGLATVVVQLNTD